MQRRHFLWLSGTAAGFGLAVRARQLSPTASVSPTVAASPTARKNLRIAVISDLNSQYGSTDYDPEVGRGIAMILDNPPDLVLCGGDLVAGQKKSLTEKQIRAMWDAFDDQIAATLRKAKIPFGFTIGNHDASGALSGNQFIFAKERNLAADYWRSRDPGLSFIDKQNYPFSYTFLQDGIFYLVWDASTSLISSEQLAWAKKSLESPTAKNATMRIAIGHLPLYGIAVGRDTPGNYLADAEKLRDFLERHGVHTYISGHAHAYYPGKRGQLELLHTGAMGSGPRRLLDSAIPARKTLTWVDIDVANGRTLYTTYDLKTSSAIDIQTLPRFIMAPNGKVFRRDLTTAN
jgi:3',5'-cyclic AMP phosphodiesterase CpdA